LYRFRKELTAEALRAPSKEFLTWKYSDLSELGGREKKSVHASRTCTNGVL
jgi:hypothetical protein